LSEEIKLSKTLEIAALSDGFSEERKPLHRLQKISLSPFLRLLDLLQK
jgi:hypothetical protein